MHTKRHSGFTLIELITIIILLGIIGTTAIGKSVRLAGAAKAASVKTLAGNIDSVSHMAAMQFYLTECGRTHGSGSGNVGDVSMHYKQAYSGDWEVRSDSNCVLSGRPLDGIPEILELINISTEKLDSFWMLHTRNGAAPHRDNLWIAPFPPDDKKGIRIVAHDAPTGDASELIATNCYIRYATPRPSFTNVLVESVTTGC